MTTPSIAYDKKELNSIVKVLRQMDETAQKEMKIAVGEIANDELSEIRRAALPDQIRSLRKLPMADLLKNHLYLVRLDLV